MSELYEKLIDLLLWADDDFSRDCHPSSAGYCDYVDIHGINYTLKLNIFPTEDEESSFY